MKYLIVLMVMCNVMNCSKRDDVGSNEYVTLSYNETQCSDVWTRGNTDAVTKTNLSNYLASQNIYFADITIKQDTTGAVCTACTCGTGKVIYVSTLKSDAILQKMKALGFK
jgi:hypothetical protein